jgi:hypothetical protein
MLGGQQITRGMNEKDKQTANDGDNARENDTVRSTWTEREINNKNTQNEQTKTQNERHQDSAKPTWAQMNETTDDGNKKKPCETRQTRELRARTFAPRLTIWLHCVPPHECFN